MAFIVLSGLAAISIGLGFGLKRIVPNLHVIMCMLIVFTMALMITSAVILGLGR